jgi:transposase
MVVVDGGGLPLACHLDSASRSEVTLLEPTLDRLNVTPGDEAPTQPGRLTLDRGYDSDPLRERLAARGIEMICPHRSNRVKPKAQDGRPLRRYRRRGEVERTFAWLGNFRRLVVRYERHLIHIPAVAVYSDGVSSGSQAGGPHDPHPAAR